MQEKSKFRSTANKAVPENFQAAFEKAIIGGQKLLYSEPMRDIIDAQLATEGRIEKKIAEGVSGLMGLIMSRSKPSLPPEIIFAVAVEMTHEVVDLVVDMGKIEKLTPEQMRLSIQCSVALLAKNMGADNAQIRNILMGKK